MLEPMVMTLYEQFLSECETYRLASGMTETGFGVAALRDPGFLFKLKKGERSPTIKTIDRVRQWMADNPPKVAA